MTLPRIAAIVFRIYIVSLLVGIVLLGVAWATGGLFDSPATIGLIWYGIAGIGTITLLVLLITRLVSQKETERLL